MLILAWKQITQKIAIIIYLLIGGGVSSMSFFLVSQNSLRVNVKSLQLLDQMVLLCCMFCTLSVQALYLCTFLASHTNTNNRQIQMLIAINAEYQHAHNSFFLNQQGIRF